MARGTELRNAFTALDTVWNLRHYRPETVHRAVGATLAYIGARRIQAALRGEPDGAQDRKLVMLLAGVEDAAIRLDAIPQRSDHADDRSEVWQEILDNVEIVDRMLHQEQELLGMRAKLAQQRAKSA